ncbi:MAG: Type III secretion system subunit [Glomeribacter sp. 1016415]|nr:Type III secretion system subunit [Glomeribacter sp. 1016415]
MANASNLIVDPLEARLYALLWRPGAAMHRHWWPALALDAWEPVYETCARSRRWIEQAIAARRGVPKASTALPKLTLLERRVLGLADKLPALLLALGLLRLGQPEYWMLKPYIEVLNPHLDAVACSQLAVFAAAVTPPGFKVQVSLVEPEQLIEHACPYGAAALTGVFAGSAVLRALEILLAPGSFDGEPLLEPAASYGLDTLFRLARFL